MPAAGGSAVRPTDAIGSIIVAGLWPNEDTLGGIEHEAAWLEQFAAAEDVRADSVDAAWHMLVSSYRSEHADQVHDRTYVVARNHGKLPQNAMARAHGLEQIAAAGHRLQAKLVEVVDRERAVIEAYCRAGLYQQAHFQLYSTARSEAAASAHEMVAEVHRLATQVAGRELALAPMNGKGNTSSNPLGGNGSRADQVQLVDHKTKHGGDLGTNSSGDAQRATGPAADENGERSNHGDMHRTGGGDERDDGRGDTSGDLGRTTETGSDTQRRPGGSRSGGPGMGSLGSGLGGSGGGSGVPSSDLGGGLGHGLGAASSSSPSMSGLDPSHFASGHDAGSAGAGLTSMSGGSSGGGSVPPPVRPPVIPSTSTTSAAAPPAAPPPATPAGPAPASGAVPAAAGGFGRATAAAGGFVAAPAAMSGPANVGAAPAASPGLAQGVPAGLASPGAAGPGGAAPPMGLTPAEMSSETPEGRIDEFGLAAVEAVKRLAPGVARYPGLLVAAACVTDRDGPPFIVVTTNEGPGWLPAGFYLPRTYDHAQLQLNSLEFTNRWYGWADPARTLVDYAKTAGVKLRGLASMGAISEETNIAWGPDGVHRITGGPKAVPSVTAEQGAQPLTDDGNGRFVHRLGVAYPEFYRSLRAFWADRPTIVSVQAALEAWSKILVLECATPLRQAGGAWALIEARGGLGRGGLTTDEWSTLRSDYEAGSVTCGALRPGFRKDSTPGTGYDSAYGRRFRELRAMEALLWFEDGGEGDPAEVVYTAAVVGASLDGIRT